MAALMSLGAMVATGASSDSAKPEPKPLAQAVQGSLSANSLEGVTARVKFTNSLIDSSAITGSSDPLLGGGSGRLWADNKGDVRIELQSDGGGGDVQILATGEKVWVSYPASGSVFVANLPKESKDADHAKRHAKKDDEWPPALSTVERVIKQLTGEANVGGATPDNVGGRPAYSASVDPKDTSGLIAGTDVSWDARNGAPLKLAIRAKGSSDPVLAIEATDVNFGPVDASVFDISPPADAKVTNLSTMLTGTRDKAGNGDKAHSSDKTRQSQPKVTGFDAVAAKVSFKLVAPAEIAGLKRSEVMLAGKGKDAAAVITYGTGLGSVVVIERNASAKKAAKAQTKQGGESQGVSLPTVDVGGAQATELPTALGTGLMFERGGVSYTVFGSVEKATAEAVARGL